MLDLYSEKDNGQESDKHGETDKQGKTKRLTKMPTHFEDFEMGSPSFYLKAVVTGPNLLGLQPILKV